MFIKKRKWYMLTPFGAVQTFFGACSCKGCVGLQAGAAGVEDVLGYGGVHVLAV